MKDPDEYRALQPRWFRLIELHPAPLSSSALKFDLTSTPIQDSPPYVALSYTWDGQSPDRLVWCCGRLLLVTANAAAAMRAVRKARKPVHLWVNAICIIQASLDEKAKQVAIMADIYQSAENVAIWLGDLGYSSALLARVLWAGLWEA